MVKETAVMAKNEKNLIKIVNKDSPAGFIFFLTYIGAAVHFVGNVDGFWNILLALLKAAVWPAFLINRVLNLLRI